MCKDRNDKGGALLRLLHLQEVNEAKGELYKEERHKFLNQEKPEIITAFNLFQTPEAVAEKMSSNISDWEGKTILEPSAGLGRLVAAVPQAYRQNIIVCDIEQKCLSHIYHKFPEVYRMKHGDFLTMSFEPDIILMNPPFKQGLDIKHIKHALSMLKAGGQLIALCYNGVRQNKELKPLADTWEVLPEDSFKYEGTRASVVLLTITQRLA